MGGKDSYFLVVELHGSLPPNVARRSGNEAFERSFLD
jgi:hypothetical protein